MFAACSDRIDDAPLEWSHLSWRAVCFIPISA
jgi:hypothetical protein